MATRSPSPIVRNLLQELVDYAGLFPPAGLAMREAVANYAGYRRGEFAWMLGRFIVPADRLDEFVAAAGPIDSDGSAWPLSVLVGAGDASAMSAIRDFNSQHSGRSLIDAIEAKAGTPDDVAKLSTILPEGVSTFVEIPAGGPEMDGLLDAIAAAGLHAKIRTGGIEESAFPSTGSVIAFVKGCVSRAIAFKATAGLHHPVRCRKPLTYAADAPVGTMHGFLNLLMMTALARRGRGDGLLTAVMLDETADDLVIAGDSLEWNVEESIDADEAAEVRLDAMISFGSCSFVEPVEDLRAIGFLP